MDKIKGDKYKYGMALPVSMPCGCHPYLTVYNRGVTNGEHHIVHAGNENGMCVE
jgi:hypothetical protein